MGARDDKIESNCQISIKLEQLLFALFDKSFDILPKDEGVAISELININPHRTLAKVELALNIPMASLIEGVGSIYSWEYDPESESGATFARQGKQFRGTAFSVRSLLQNSQTVNRAVMRSLS
ncbi:hypothetical protein [uncultured Olegusella sp.]|uniref:hypothetical protein n=1 Tax=uncultured Olegusella sp. TaxID=1979846 RepID=UPI00262954F7|nr:hypothetical protein [uncultured Olegusella sp.]